MVSAHNRSARDVRRLPGRVNHPDLAARNQLRASERLARARLCFELSGSQPGVVFSAFSWTQNHLANCSHQENECV